MQDWDMSCIFCPFCCTAPLPCSASITLIFQMESMLKALEEKQQQEQLAEKVTDLTAQLAALEADAQRLAQEVQQVGSSNAALRADHEAAVSAAGRELEAVTAAKAEKQQEVFVAARQHKVNEARWVVLRMGSS